MKYITTFILCAMLLSTCALSPKQSNIINVSPIAGDDTANIQAAFDLLNTGLGNHNPAYLEFEPGVYDITGTLNLKQKYRVIVNGQGAVLQGNFTLNASGSYATIRDLNLHSTSTNPAIIYGRDNTGAGGNFGLHNVDVFSNNNIGAVLFGQADTSTITDSEIYNGGNAPALILTSENETGLLDWEQSTATLMSIRDCYIHGAGDVLVSMRGLIQNVTFDTVFFMPNGASVELTSGQAHAISFHNSRSEGLANAVLLRTLPGTIAEGVYFQQYVHAVINADYVLDIQGTATNFEKTFISLSNSETNFANVTGSLSFIGDADKLKKVTVTNAPGNFAYADAEIIQLQNASLIWFAPLRDPQRVLIVFDGNSTISGGYFIGIPDPYTPPAGTVLEFLSNGWYWTKVQ